MAKQKKKWQKAGWTIGEKAQKDNHASAGKRITKKILDDGMEGHFVNPYNFERDELSPAKAEGLPFTNGRESFHEGCLTGKLVCNLRLITPLFIPDPEKTKESFNNNPKQMVFMRDADGNPFIPGTSLKGMLRSILETLSNSCFSQVCGTRLDFRKIQISKDVKPALVLDIDESKGSATIALLDEAAWLPAGYLDYGKSDCRSNLHNQKGQLRFAFANIEKVPEKVKPTGRKVPAHYSVVGKLQRDLASLPKPASGIIQRQVLIKHTGKTIPNKHDERVFFSNEFKADLESNITSLQSEQVPLSAVRDLDFVLKEQHERFRRDKGEFPADEEMAMRLNRKGRVKIKKNDLVYYYAGGGNPALAIVLVPRMRYRKSPADLLPEHIRPCSNRDLLCPACRIFGTVTQEGEGIQGKVAVSEGVLKSKAPAFEGDVLLKILSSPKPTAAPFYLTGRNYDNSNPVNADEGYDRANTILRGRKFYWLSTGGYSSNEPSKFNSRVELLKAKSEDAKPTVFSFTLDFENLTPEELGLLIWALELEPDMCHRLGMGKPLGLGVVKMSIDRSESFALNHAALCHLYTDPTLKATALCRQENTAWDDWKGLAVKKFGGLTNFSDLKALLSYDANVINDVKYPQRGRIIDHVLRYVGYEWFSKNKKQQLLTAEQVKNGERQTGWQGGA